MTAPLIDAATQAELAPACELDDCGQPARDVITYTFRGILADLPPRHVLACTEHAQQTAVHQVWCDECPGTWHLRVQPIGGRR